MTLVVGIDPSAKKIALVAHEDVLSVISAQTFNLYPKGATRQTPESLGNALRDMGQFLQWAEQVTTSRTRRLAWVENPLVGRGGVASSVKQAFVGGIIRATLHQAGFEVRDVNVQTWKKQVCGNGHSDKAAVMLSVMQKWPKAHTLVKDDGDLADAAAINIYGREVIRRAETITTDAGSYGRAVRE